MDPKSNTGMCSVRPCPFCKPKDCCGYHHKHFVINAKSREGICVRQTDDCTAACVPRDVPQAGAHRACSKGCNQLVKVHKSSLETGAVGSKSYTKTEKGSNLSQASLNLYMLAVCQSEKQVFCKPPTSHASISCEVERTVKPTVICTFDEEIWNLGGTCISDTLYDLPLKQCPKSVRANAAVKKINTSCRKALARDVQVCSTLALSF